MKQTLATALVCSHSTTAREVISFDLVGSLVALAS